MMKTFQAKFMEVYDTHMVHEPFISMSGPDGLAKDADNLLSGDLDIPACIHPDIVEVLTFIKMDDEIMNSDQVRLDTRFKELCDFWKLNQGKHSPLCLSYTMVIT